MSDEDNHEVNPPPQQSASGADEVAVKDWGNCQSITGSGGPPPNYRWRGNVK